MWNRVGIFWSLVFLFIFFIFVTVVLNLRLIVEGRSLRNEFWKKWIAWLGWWITKSFSIWPDLKWASSTLLWAVHTRPVLIEIYVLLTKRFTSTTLPVTRAPYAFSVLHFRYLSRGHYKHDYFWKIPSAT
jgi:hypothetical protein